MKKILSLLIMMMFVFSIISIVYAESEGNVMQGNIDTEDTVDSEDNSDDEEESDDTGVKGKLRIQNGKIREKAKERLELAKETRTKKLEILREGDKLTEEDIEKLQALTRAKIQSLKDLNQDQIGAYLARLRLVKVDSQAKILKSRILTQERIYNAKQKIRNVVAQYNAAKNRYQEHRQILVGMSDELKDCKETDYASEECQELQEEGFENGQQMLLNTAERAKNAIEEKISRIEGSEDVDDEKAEEWIADLNEINALLDEIIEKINNAEDAQDLRDVAKELNALLRRIHNRVQIVAYNYANAGVWGIIKRAEHLEKKLDKKLEKLEETGEIEDKLNEFSRLIQSAKDNAELADEKFKEAHELRRNNGDSEDIKTLIDEGREYQKKAKEDIKEAYEVMKKILKELRNLSGESSIDLSEEDEELEDEAYEVIEEEDSDDDDNLDQELTS